MVVIGTTALLDSLAHSIHDFLPPTYWSFSMSNRLSIVFASTVVACAILIAAFSGSAIGAECIGTQSI